MSIFSKPAGLSELAHFTMRRVQTWGNRADAHYRQQVREASGLTAADAQGFAWFVFCIRCIVDDHRGRHRFQVPDVENIPKLIVDAFTGLLYPDDNLHHVRGVQVEAEWGPDGEERAEIWIYGWPKAES